MPDITTERNFSVVQISQLRIWFSYQSMVAFAIGGDRRVCENVWSCTTGKHLNWIDGGSREAIKQRLSRRAFQEEWNKIGDRLDDIIDASLLYPPPPPVVEKQRQPDRRRSIVFRPRPEEPAAVT